MVCVEFAGPPPVSVKISVKIWKDLIEFMDMTKSVVGFNSGSVILRIVCHFRCPIDLGRFVKFHGHTLKASHIEDGVVTHGRPHIHEHY